MNSSDHAGPPVIVSVLGTERELVHRLRNRATNGHASATSVLASGALSPADEALVRIHQTSPQRPHVTILVPRNAPLNGAGRAAVLGRLTRSRASGPGVIAAMDPIALDVVEASLDPDGEAPAARVVQAIARAHGFTVAVEPGEGSVSGAAAADGPGPTRRGQRELRRRTRTIRRSYASDQTEWAKRFPGFGGQAPAAGSSYAGSQELHALSKSVRFHRWMAELLAPAIGHDVLEVGAGIGTMTRALAETYPNSNLMSIEPDPALFPMLADRAPVGVVPSTQSTLELPSEPAFDTLLYINVLEHIEDHAGELRRARSLLKPTGRIGIVVPALPSLYGSLDAKTGHFRRYQRQPLRGLVEAAGFRVVELSYFDTVGVLPYWASIRLGSMPGLSDRTTMLFDNVLVPMSKAFRRVWPSAPIGKNLLVIAERLD